MQLDFDFVGKFARLSELQLQVDQNLSHDSLASLAKYFGKLACGYFRFEPGKKRFWVRKIYGSKACQVSGFNVNHNICIFLQTEDSIEVVKFFESLSLKTSQTLSG